MSAMSSAKPIPTDSTWRKCGSVTVPGADLHSYVSSATGLRALLAKTDEPLCSMHMAIATEADTNEYSHKDDGLPHVLEHETFLGSELYPYKGLLDKLANRSLADGTNAWTATDHTCYTLTTAGQRGMLNMLPIYADHVFYPTLTEAGFTTEIHHVTAEGEDHGVVYIEMQGRENDSSSLVDRAVMDLLYPTGGYSAETGGKMKNLRTLTNAQVARYHSENYRPDNTLLVVSGLVDEADFLAAVVALEKRVLSKQAQQATASTAPRRRPWSDPVCTMAALGVEGIVIGSVSPAAAEPTVAGTPRTIYFPTEDESVGTVSMAWRGPAYGDAAAWQKLLVLQKYLTDSAASPLAKAFVECETPLCGDVGPAHEVFVSGYHQLWFEDADVATLDEIPHAFFKHLIAAKESFSMERMGLCIRRLRRTHLSSLEKHPTDTLIDPLMRYFLYYPTEAESARAGLAECCDPLAQLPALEAMSCEDWQAFLSTWYLDRPCAVVVGRPSASLVKENADIESARVEKQKEALGPAKLAELGEALDAAVAANSKEIPKKLLTGVPIPSKSEVGAIPLASVVGGGQTSFALVAGSGAGIEASLTSKLVSLLPRPASLSPLPYWLQASLVDSPFLMISVALDSSNVPALLRPYLPLLLELWFKASATLEDGTRLSKDAFVAALEDDTVSYEARFGLHGAIAQLVCASVKLELDATDPEATLAKGLGWMRRALHLTRYSASNVRMTAKRLLSSIPGTFRDGNEMTDHVHACLTLDGARANAVACTPMVQQPFLQTLLARLETPDGASHVLNMLHLLRRHLVAPQRMQFLIAGRLTALSQPYEALVAAITPPATLPELADDEAEEEQGEEEEEEQSGEEEGGEEGAEKGGEDGKDGEEGEEAVAERAPKPKKPIAGPRLEGMPPEANAAIAACEQPTGAVGLLSGLRSASLQLHRPLMAGAVVGLSAIENAYVVLSSTGIGPYHPDVAALRVVIEHLTALEGDFWVRLRGAGLTYGAGLSNITESEQLQLTLYRCGDALAAYSASKEIITEYVTGKATISQIDLEGAKSSLTYNLISSTASKPAAIWNQWAAGYKGVQADYTSWLLSRVDDVSAADALQALKRHLTPLFEPSAVLVVSSPAGKANELAIALGKAHAGSPLSILSEEELSSRLGGGGADAKSASGGHVPLS